VHGRPRARRGPPGAADPARPRTERRRLALARSRRSERYRAPRGGAGYVIRVAIADDHRVVRVGLEQLLGTFDDVELIGAAAGGEEAATLCAAARPDVLLLDLAMPDLDGIAVTRRVVAEAPATRVVLFTSFSDREGIVAALDAGAVGYLLKDAEPQEIHSAIRAAARGEAPLAPKAAATLLAERGPRSDDGPELTRREQEILAL